MDILKELSELKKALISQLEEFDAGSVEAKFYDEDGYVVSIRVYRDAADELEN